MKIRAVKIEAKHPLKALHDAMLAYKEMMARMTETVRPLEARIRRNLQELYPETDWLLVHKLEFRDDEIELVTYEHSLERLVGPMTEEERERVDQLREQLSAGKPSGKLDS